MRRLLLFLVLIVVAVAVVGISFALMRKADRNLRGTGLLNHAASASPGGVAQREGAAHQRGSSGTGEAVSGTGPSEEETAVAPLSLLALAAFVNLKT